MIELITALKGSTAIGTFYASNVIFMPKQYLEDHGVVADENTEYLSKGVAGGVIALTVATGLAAFSDNTEAQQIAAKANLAAFAFWGVTGIQKNFFGKAPPTKGDQIDLGICTAMLITFGMAMA